jgi:hypothetical protein
MASNQPPPDKGKLDKVIAEARRRRELSESGYRERALKLFPWVCGRCAREFSGANVRMLTVHHKDGNHDNNPLDGGNWELLCIYCHENEHARLLDQAQGGTDGGGRQPAATHKPFAALESLLKRKGGG